MTDTSRFDRLVTLLKELFQLDKPELDFGFYRIMHARSREVTQFLEKDLPPRVRKAFAEHRSADQARVEAELTEAIRNARALGMDPDQVDKVTRLRKKLGNATVDIAALESDVYDHLYRFFRRYYDEGDFLSKRVYKDGVYAIPYAGEEVKLHWANADQYYIKTDEYLKNYSFRLRPDAPDDPMRAHFRLVDATEGEHGNVQAAAGQKRLLVLAGENPVALERGRDSGRDELVIRFEYRPVRKEEWPNPNADRAPKQSTLREHLLTDAEEGIHEAGRGRTELYPWIRELEKPHRKAGTNARTTTVDKKSKDKPKSLLRAHLDRYTARNTFDYFIHKDLGPFLRRELDFYIKNEVMHLDDIENDTAPSVEQYLSKIRVIRRIAHTLIDFLAELEGFQKKLWLKKKFVVETRWLVQVGVIADVAPELLKEIAANDAQREEWVELCGMDESPGDQGELMAAKYEVPLTVAFLKQHPTLMVDTRHFGNGFTARLLAAFDDLDAVTDGVLVHGENFQALGLLGEEWRGAVDCVHIDPPYNSGSRGFLYKNDYQHASWMTMMAGRIADAVPLLRRDTGSEGAFVCHIDEHECERLQLLFGDLMIPDAGTIVWDKKNPMLGGKGVATQHEQILWRTWSGGSVYTRPAMARKIAAKAKALIRKRGQVDDWVRGRFAKWIQKAQGLTGGERAYRLVNQDGRVFQSVGMGAPEHRADPKFHVPVIHPTTGRRCPVPRRGWSRTPEKIQELLKQDEIVFGPDETTQPRRKVFLNVDHGRQLSSVIRNGMKGHIEIGKHGLEFAYCHPTSLYMDLLGAGVPKEGGCVLDHFAGSGTTGHAVINLNREDGGTRKFILVEVGEHFDTVLVPRLKKVTYSPEWKNGRPIRAANADEADRSPRVIKSLRIESYEDTLNNLTIAQYPSKKQGGGGSPNALSPRLGEAADSGSQPDSARLPDEYRLRYILDVETRGSRSLLDVGALLDPDKYHLDVKRQGSDESRVETVDLAETFNHLLGLRVSRMAAPEWYGAKTERDQDGCVTVAELSEDAGGPWRLRPIHGTLPDGRTALVIWRNRPGGDEPHGIARDNAVLDAWFKRKQFQESGCRVDVVYVNGDQNLERLRDPDETWTVRMIEADFQRLMFAMETNR